jgi:alkylation response protein AidB-like acyl-CoA dehydrogenase
MSLEDHKWAKQFREKMGEKGWLFPTWPKEYGGGGLPVEYDVVIQEEVAKRRVPRFMPSELMAAAIMVWGTEEQKQGLVTPMLQGKMGTFQLFTEPSSGSDLASLRTKAVKDGDDWIITGEKVFVGEHSGSKLGPQEEPNVLDEVDEMFTLAITDPQAPRHRNMGYFIVPANLPGITFQKLDLLADWGKMQIYLDNVRVPGNRLIGAAGQGWQVAQTSLELEHGGGGQVVSRDYAAEQLVQYARETGKLKDPHLMHAVMDAHIDAEIGRLIGLRNYWMYENKQEMSYHGSQNSLWRKESALRIADNMREVAGLTALLDRNDEKSPFFGEFEHFQRDSLVRAHPGGTIEVQRVIMARRLGVSRTKEKAAATPNTAGSHNKK